MILAAVLGMVLTTAPVILTPTPVAPHNAPSEIPAYAFFGLSSICATTALANLAWVAALLADGSVTSVTTGFGRSLLVSSASAAGVATAFAGLGLLVLIRHLSGADPG